MPDGDPRRAAGSGRTIAGAVAVSASGSLAVFLVGSLAIQIRGSLRFGPASLGIAISVYYAGAALGSVPFGRLAEAIGGARAMRAAAGAGTAVLLLLAVAAHSFDVLAALLFAAGLVSSAIQPATNLFLARRTPPDRQGLAFGIKQAAVPTSALLAGLAVPAIALTVGWRWAFVGAAAVAAAAALSVPRPRTSLADRRGAPRPTARPGSLAPLAVLAAGFGLGVFTATGLSAFTVSSAVAAGLAPGTAGLLAALGGALSVGARVTSGARADRRGRAHLPVVSVMLAAGAAGYVAIAAGAAQHDAALLVAGVAVAYGAGWGWNGLFNFAIVRTHSEAPARATAITQVGGRLAGAVGPLSFGLIATHASYATAWVVNAGAAVAAAAVILAGRRMLVASRRVA